MRTCGTGIGFNNQWRTTHFSEVNEERIPLLSYHVRKRYRKQLDGIVMLSWK